MRVLVTGRRGLLGCHTVGHLLDAGQQVQVLARDPDRLDAALGPVGYRSGGVSVVSGDMTDPASVAAAVAGCDAVVLAEAVYSLDPRQHEVMRATNALGTRLVLESAPEAGAQRIVHVSSYSTLVQPNQTIRPDGPLTSLTTPYILSKVESEKIGRGLRDRGAPVFVVNPPGLSRSGRSVLRRHQQDRDGCAEVPGSDVAEGEHRVGRHPGHGGHHCRDAQRSVPFQCLLRTEHDPPRPCASGRAQAGNGSQSANHSGPRVGRPDGRARDRPGSQQATGGLATTGVRRGRAARMRQSEGR